MDRGLTPDEAGRRGSKAGPYASCCDRYVDSVRLMRVAQDPCATDGVRACEILSGTPANLDLLSAPGRRPTPAPGDIVIAVDAPGGSDRALDAAEQALAGAGGTSAARCGGRGRAVAGGRRPPAAGANLALISVPGEYAALEAHRALSAGHARVPLLRSRLGGGRGRAQAPRRASAACS